MTVLRGERREYNEYCIDEIDGMEMDSLSLSSMVEQVWPG